MQFFPSYHLSGASPLPLDVGVSFYGGIQHSPVNGCSAASCTFGVLAGDEHTSFYSDLVQPLKRIIHHSQVGLIPGSQSQLNISKSTTVIHHSDEKKYENHKIVSIDAKKKII